MQYIAHPTRPPRKSTRSHGSELARASRDVRRDQADADDAARLGVHVRDDGFERGIGYRHAGAVLAAPEDDGIELLSLATREDGRGDALDGRRIDLRRDSRRPLHRLGYLAERTPDVIRHLAAVGERIADEQRPSVDEPP